MHLKAPSLPTLTLALTLTLSLGLSLPSHAADQTASTSNSVDKQPIPRTQSNPIYPAELAAAGTSGEVTVDFIVDTEGKVRDAKAIKQTNEAFGAAAVAAVSKWTFKPGLKDGKPVNTHMQVPLSFTPPKKKKS